MNDTNPQTNGDYTNPEQNPQTSESTSGTFDNSSVSSSSTASENPITLNVPPLPGSTPQYQAPEYGTPQHDFDSSQPTPQSTAPQASTPQASTPQSSAPQSAEQYDAPQPVSHPTPQSNSSQSAPQYGSTPQSAPQYNSVVQQTPQYNNPQQAQNNVPPQFAANQLAGSQSGASVFPGNMPGQPYGNPNQGPDNFAPAMAVPLDMPYYGCPPVEAVKRFFLKYVKFSGRASRSEYWWVQLFLLIVYFLFFFLDGLLFRKGAGFINLILELALFIPSISIAVRRLHDSNKSGWWWLLPSGLNIAGLMVMVISLVVGIGGIALSNPSRFVFGAFGAGMIIAMIIAFLCMLAGFVLEIILMVLGPNPQGARFDEVSAPGTFAGGQYMPVMNQGNPAGNQYGGYTQPMPQQPQQNPFNQAYPQTLTQPASANNPYTQTGNPRYQPRTAAQPQEPSQSQDSFGQQGQQGQQAQQEAQTPQTPQPDNGFGGGNNYENNSNGNGSVQ